MPTEVGNAIYLYIKNARPKTDCHSVFIKSRAPFDTVQREVCLRALKSTLPERVCPGSGFHVTRKTFATEQICRDVGKHTIADMLGQRDTSSLSHYLNLDSDRMLMCPLSLLETGLTMEAVRYD
jgi:integrase